MSPRIAPDEFSIARSESKCPTEDDSNFTTRWRLIKAGRARDLAAPLLGASIRDEADYLATWIMSISIRLNLVWLANLAIGHIPFHL